MVTGIVGGAKLDDEGLGAGDGRASTGASIDEAIEMLAFVGVFVGTLVGFSISRP